MTALFVRLAARLLAPAVLLSTLIGAVLLVAPGQAGAQEECPPWVIDCEGEPGDPNPPAVTILPSTLSYSGTAGTYNLSVTVEWCDDNSLVSGTRSIVFRGQSVTSSFSYTTSSKAGCAAFARSIGTVTLQPGSNSFSASIQDAHANVGSNSKTYSYAHATYAVTVTPDGQAVTATANASNSYTFNVINGNNFLGGQSQYILVATCTPPAATNCSAPASMNVPAGGIPFPVTVTYQGGPIGATGGVSLRATATFPSNVQDEGSIAVTTMGVVTDYSVTVADANAQTTPERDLCLTIAISSDAAFECGDLRIVHGLTGARTMNQQRAPTLLYNSRQAQASPLLAAHVTLPTNSVTPTKVTATLSVRRVGTSTWLPRASGEWQGSSFQPGMPTRIALSYDAPGDGTGVYEYRYEVTVWYSNSSQVIPAVTGKFILVDRSQLSTSPFGAGWWIAGLEQLQFVGDAAGDAGSLVWVGGDGSARLYTSIGSGRWIAQPVDRPDTLVRDGTGYMRILRNGLVVRFNAQGQHVATVTRLGHTTSFTYVSGRLDRIELPIPSTTQLTRYCSTPATCLPAGTPPAPSIAAPFYRFYYEAGRIRIVLPPSPTLQGQLVARETILNLTGSVVSSIVDPDGVQTKYEYGTGNLVRRIAAVIDRRGTRTRFDYTTGHVLTYASLDSALNLPWIETRFNPVAEAQGLAASGTMAPAVAVPDVHTLLDGPRPNADALDHTKLWTDRFGAPTKIRNAHGDHTLLTRADPRFPALVTEMQAPNGLVTRATYDARGNVATSTVVNARGDNVDAVTTYSWNQRFDFVESVILPEGEVATFTYSALNGNRLTQRDGRGAPSEVTFEYYQSWTAPGAPGLLKATVLPGTIRDEITYDGLGNLAGIKTPRNSWTRFVNDTVGRTKVVRQQIDFAGTKYREDTTTFDVMDRVKETVSFGPALATPGGNTVVERLTVRNFYEAAGTLERVERFSTPELGGSTPIGTITTHWRYDRAGRRIVEIAPDRTPSVLTDNPRDSTVYDLAGNAIQVFGRRNCQVGVRCRIDMKYDALGRLIERRLPEVVYPKRQEGVALLPPHVPDNPGQYPRFPNNAAGGLTIAADVATYQYDAVGNALRADNGEALIGRTYDRAGRIKTETLQIRTVKTLSEGGNFTAHVYVIEYAYDLNGHRTAMKHPAQLAPVANATTTYLYDDVTGHLDRITDPLGYQFGFDYNMRNELEFLQLPAGVTESYQYHPDGTLAVHGVSGSSSLQRQSTLTYDARGKILGTVNTVGTADEQTNYYSGLGHLVRSELDALAFNSSGAVISYASLERFTLDALGNHFQVFTSAGTTFPGQGTIPEGGQDTQRSYEPGIGRLAGMISSTGGRDTLKYDAAGNTEFETQLPALSASRDRASYYAADGTLRVVDRRVRHNNFNITTVYDEYRYDALGRRILVRSRRFCSIPSPSGLEQDECNLDFIRRTVWDGSEELYEIQMPGDDASGLLENDTDWVSIPSGTSGLDPNPYFGRVAYTHGADIDQPLGITRIRYVDDSTGAVPPRQWDPFTIVPLWNVRRQADMGYFADGPVSKCVTGVPTHCVKLAFPAQFYALGRTSGFVHFWHGTLLQNKEDKTGTFFRRNRYYDPHTGRFSQEDPIGLAGGINLYGLAMGDPVNFSDPFGLCVPPDSPFCQVALDIARRTQPLKQIVETVGEVAGLRTLSEGVDDLGSGRVLAGSAKLAMSLPVSRGGSAAARLFTRFGTRAETAADLASQATQAERKIGVHGVSVRLGSGFRTRGAIASEQALSEAGFPLVKTGADPRHYTAVLPKPVTAAVTAAWNRVWGWIK